jgi:hypothetical protein
MEGITVNDEYIKVNGFPDDFQEVFEDYIDNYGTFDGTFEYMKGHCKATANMDLTRQNLDYFCQKVYNMDYKATFLYISGFTNGCLRKAIVNLAKDGNSKALDIASEHFMKLGQDQTKANARITINAVVPVEKVGGNNEEK